jgi:pimeloyl-ACP methyl ester carboxylesterase
MGYVLVHGGATTARHWDLVLPYLDGPAVAVNMPGRLDRPGDLATLTVDEAAASIVQDVQRSVLREADDLVVVAHSSGGLEVPSIVEGLGSSRVRAVVLNAASVPPEGGNGLDCMQVKHREASLQAIDAAEAAGISITTPMPRPEKLKTSSGEELDDQQHAFVSDPTRNVEDSFNLYLQPVHWSKAAGIPITYVLNLRDRAVPPELQREMAARLPSPSTLIELDSGHLAAVTHPEQLADLIRSAGHASRP